MTRAPAEPIGSIKVWRDVVGRRLLNLDFDPVSPEEFWAKVEPIAGPLRTARVSQSAGCSFRDAELVRDGDDVYSLAVCRGGRIRVTQRGQEIVLGPGDAAFLRTSEIGSLASARPFTHCSIMFPAAELLRCAPDADQWVMRRIPAGTEALRLLMSYVASVGRQPPQDPAVQGMVRRHLFDAAALLGAGDGRAAGQGDASPQALRLRAAQDMIAQRFCEPDLSVATVAAGVGISPRYLQRLFECAGQSFTQHLSELRLRAAYELLQSVGGARRITDVALGVGFSDISHFNRSFRRLFGETPTAVRSHGIKSH
jgi:AraC-like DNA-binding protein